MSVTHNDIHHPDWTPDFSEKKSIWLPSFGLPVETVAFVYKDEGYGREGSPLFYVPNVDISLDADRSRDYKNGLGSRHPWARDEEADPCHTAIFEINYLNIIYMMENHIQLRGLLTKVQAWDPEMENPFDDAVKLPEEQPDGSGYNGYANAGYPYQPPNVLMKATRVVVEFQYGSFLNDWWIKNVEGAERG
jgi:hypothetical protein